MNLVDMDDENIAVVQSYPNDTFDLQNTRRNFAETTISHLAKHTHMSRISGKYVTGTHSQFSRYGETGTFEPNGTRSVQIKTNICTVVISQTISWVSQVRLATVAQISVFIE